MKPNLPILLVALAVILNIGAGFYAEKPHPRVMTDQARLESVLDLYKLDVGTYPTTEQGLQALLTQPQGVEHWGGPYLQHNRIPKDYWGRPFGYRSPSEDPGKEFDLYVQPPPSEGTQAQPSDNSDENPIMNVIMLAGGVGLLASPLICLGSGGYLLYKGSPVQGIFSIVVAFVIGWYWIMQITTLCGGC
jgi:type II secretion system protein G